MVAIVTSMDSSLDSTFQGDLCNVRAFRGYFDRFATNSSMMMSATVRVNLISLSDDYRLFLK
jgi:hypothetical protein